ncbi:MAG: DNA-binding protein [Halanaeroarchaeum sp.]
MSDPTHVTDALDSAEDAFEFVGHGVAEFENGIDGTADWKTQLTKACRYLEACRVLRSKDGFSGAVIELCFGAIERTLEAYLLWETGDDLDQYHDHEAMYDRVAERGLFSIDTAENLKQLYATNRTEHYYGGLVPTHQKESAMIELAEAIHRYVPEQISDEDVCRCGP